MAPNSRHANSTHPPKESRAGDHVDDFLAAEYEQSWTHYRHVEGQRVQYLGFFFTVTLAAAAFVGPLLTLRDADRTTLLVAGVAFLFVYGTTGCFVYATLRRMSMVLNHYDRCMQVIREHREATRDVPAELRSLLSTIHVQPQTGRRIFSTQLLAERIVWTSVAASSLASVAIAGYAGSSKLWIVASVSTVTAIALGWGASLLWRRGQPFRSPGLK